ncbi:hypothetical protein D9619_012208 [Psilocybe cf. subviscida]|uniref:Uncharacterized protein n=1 Tax=Psilocybe cf. subviscida TaxID=2480587 RepID=A0A8H5B7H3_9AGAR|nr:hypothetical protein D9619_012208 [Psilocybe cf. subviscida]
MVLDFKTATDTGKRGEISRAVDKLLEIADKKAKYMAIANDVAIRVNVDLWYFQGRIFEPDHDERSTFVA